MAAVTPPLDETEFNDRVARAGDLDDPEPIAAATPETLGEASGDGTFTEGEGAR